MASLIVGSIAALGCDKAHIVDSRLRSGVINVVDKCSQALLSGIVIEESRKKPGDSTFIAESILGLNDLSLCLYDSTYMGGYWSDGTLVDSTYWGFRAFNPIWINYSIWRVLDGTKVLEGYQLRPAVNSGVGLFYAYMYAPEKAGQYEIRWRYQRDKSSLACEVIEPFSILGAI